MTARLQGLELREVVAGIVAGVASLERPPKPAVLRALLVGLLGAGARAEGRAPATSRSAQAKAPARVLCTTCASRPPDGGRASCRYCRKAESRARLDRKHRSAKASPRAAGRETRTPAAGDKSPAADPEEPPGLIPYAKFNAGVDFATAAQMLWSGSEDRRDWKQRGRGVVLGFMRRWKREAYRHYVEEATRPVQPCDAVCFCQRCTEPARSN